MQKTNKKSRTFIAVGIACAFFQLQVLAQDQTQAPAMSTEKAKMPGGLASGAIEDSVITVDQLLKVDNLMAKEKAMQEGLSSGAIRPQSVAGPNLQMEVPTSVTVNQVTAIDGRYKISVNYNGLEMNNLGIGDKVQSCEIVQFQNKCLTLRPVVQSTNKWQKMGKAAQKKAQRQCPTSCWVGQPSMQFDQPIQGGGMQFVNRTAPAMPSPIYSSVGGPDIPMQRMPQNMQQPSMMQR